jgi:hypothetical protein
MAEQGQRKGEDAHPLPVSCQTGFGSVHRVAHSPCPEPAHHGVRPTSSRFGNSPDHPIGDTRPEMTEVPP